MARSSMRRLCCLVNVSAESGERNSITADLAPESTWGGGGSESLSLLDGLSLLVGLSLLDGLSLLVGLPPEPPCSPGWP